VCVLGGGDGLLWLEGGGQDEFVVKMLVCGHEVLLQALWVHEWVRTTNLCVRVRVCMCVCV